MIHLIIVFTILMKKTGALRPRLLPEQNSGLIKNSSISLPDLVGVFYYFILHGYENLTIFF